MHPGYSWKCWIGVWTQVEQWHVCSVPGSHTSRVWLTALTLSLQSVVCPLLTLGAGAGLLRAVLWLLLGVSTASLVPAAVLCTCTLMGACTVPHFSCSGCVQTDLPLHLFSTTYRMGSPHFCFLQAFQTLHYPPCPSKNLSLSLCLLSLAAYLFILICYVSATVTHTQGSVPTVRNLMV